MKQDKKEVWLKQLKDSLAIFDVVASTADYILEKIHYERLRYYNVDYLAAAIYTEDQQDKYREALSLIGKDSSIASRIALASYIQRLIEKKKIYIPSNVYTRLVREFPVDVVEIMALSAVVDVEYSSDISFESALTLEEYLNHDIDLPPENSFMKIANTQKLVSLVKKGWYIPDLSSTNVYVIEKKKVLAFSGTPSPITEVAKPIDFVNYMKWAIAVASNWTYLADIFNELSADPDLIKGVLTVANTELNLKALKLDRVTIDDLSVVFYRDAPGVTETIPFESTGTGNGMYATIPGEIFSLDASGIMNCVRIASLYYNLIGNIEVTEGEFRSKREISFIFVETTDEIDVIVDGLRVTLPVGHAIVVSEGVKIHVEGNFLVVT